MTYDYCCSRDGHGLEIPGFSAVFIQTFSIKQELQFLLPDCYVRHLPGEKNRYLSCAMKVNLLTRKMSGASLSVASTSRCR